MPDRRSVLMGAVAAACAPRMSDDLYGRATLSQSVMLSGADAAGEHFLAVRGSTYPDAGVAWLWIMLLTRDGFWQYARNDLPWRGRATDPDAPRGAYLIESARDRASFRRGGPAAAPMAAMASVAFDSNPGLGAGVGRGRVTIEAAFAPNDGHAGLLPGRSEAFGRVSAHCAIDGVGFDLEGPGQFHEQTQTTPRFTTPFAFASLWSDDVVATLLETPEGSGGYIIESRKVTPLSAVRADLAPAALGLSFLRAGAGDRIALDAARTYALPIWGETWTGRFVRGRYGTTRLVGYLNSWRR